MADRRADSEGNDESDRAKTVGKFEEVGKYIMPGYYRDQCEPKTVADQRRPKGRLWRFKHTFANYFILKAWQLGVIEYVLVRAAKP
jgi:hypothetical protein